MHCRLPHLTAFVALVVPMLGPLDAAPASAAASDASCSTRYDRSASFPDLAAGELPTADGLLAALGGKGWGVRENLTMRRLEGAPSPFVLEVRLPEGSINPGSRNAPVGGMGWRWRPPLPPQTRAACLSYWVWFPEDFDFNKGGKLPGLFGGDAPAGGKETDGTRGFSARFMFRRGGAGEIYAYIPGHPEKRGLSIQRGAFRFEPGRWTHVEEEVVLNSPGVADGSLTAWIDGAAKISLTEVLYRRSESVSVAGLMADVFYGGRDPSWAAPRDTIVRFSPFTLYWQ